MVKIIEAAKGQYGEYLLLENTVEPLNKYIAWDPSTKTYAVWRSKCEAVDALNRKLYARKNPTVLVRNPYPDLQLPADILLMLIKSVKNQYQQAC